VRVGEMENLASWKKTMTSLFIVVVLGSVLSLFTGLLENRPDASMIEVTYYGLPLAWRIVKTFQPTEIQPLNLALDIAFWGMIIFLAFILLTRDQEAWQLRHKVKSILTESTYKRILPWFLAFLPVGFVMDLIHEGGHALGGITQGGVFTYMQIAFFQIYPTLSLANDFRLGYTVVEGIPGNFSRGVFLLGGALTTHVASWLLALILWKIHLGYKTRVLLWTLGLFGLLDLPFYVFFPQIGLKHWIFVGGSSAEPLLGARLMGLPDPLFYFLFGFTTLFLGFLYTKLLHSLADHSINEES
jgi:hypothetical protein